MRIRPRYLTLIEAEADMVLASPVTVVNHGVLSMTLPAGHILTTESLQQLRSHQAEFLYVCEEDERCSEQIALDSASAAHQVLDIFAGAELSDPNMAAFFDQVLTFRSL